MTKEHGGRFFPLLWNYWGPKIGRAGRMVRNGELRLVRSKLGEYALSFVRHQVTRNKSDY